MKISTLIWICLAIAAAFMIGRHFERAAALQSEVGNLKERVGELEAHNMRREERWGWASRIGSRIPLIKHLFNRSSN